MNEQVQEDISRSPGWYRKVLNLLWVIGAAILMFDAARLGLGADSVSRALITEILLIPAVIAAVELLSFKTCWRTDFLPIAGSVFTGACFIAAHPLLPAAPAILFGPLLVSVQFFRRGRVAFAVLMSVAAVCSLYALLPEFRGMYQLSGLTDLILLLAGGGWLSFAAMNRGLEISSHLRQLHETKQDLLVKTIIMDKLYKLDALTELYNHKTFHEYLEKLVEQSDANGLPLQVAVIDIDDFKKVNDTYGHWVGDIVLMRIAAILRGGVTSDDFVARYGGEEFAVIFTDKTLSQSYESLERIRETVAETQHEELGFKPVTVSIGVEEYQKGTGKAALFKHADASLYTAKKRGKNQTACIGLARTAAVAKQA